MGRRDPIFGEACTSIDSRLDTLIELTERQNELLAKLLEKDSDAKQKTKKVTKGNESE